jgi:hypothetical protein
MGDTVTDTAQRTWELSAAYENWNAERRAHVVKVLDNFGASGYNDWPNRAAITDILVPEMRPSAMYNYVQCGTQGIHRNIPREKMPVAREIIWPNIGMFDVWFVPAVHGNTDNARCSEWELVAYITTLHDLVVIHLGCNHTDKQVIRTANQYTRYQCSTCDYTWGVDTSD